MKYDIILAGVGGQGVLSLAAVIATGAMMDGLTVRQSEVHGMAQRGGAVLANLRMADGPIHADLIGRGSAEMILAMEPLESLRYLEYLSAQGGVVVSSGDPFVNIPDYPDTQAVREAVEALPSAIVVDADSLAKEAGSVKAANMVMVGAASVHLPVSAETLERAIIRIFERKGTKVTDTNIKAFRAGREVTFLPA